MKNEFLFLNLILKDSFIINGKVHFGYYDGYYRKLIKTNITNIKNKTSFNSFLEYHFEIIDFPDSTHLRIILSVPKGWSAERFKEVSVKEITSNPSVELISEIFFSSLPHIRVKFFSSEWRGMKGQNSPL